MSCIYICFRRNYIWIVEYNCDMEIAVARNFLVESGWIDFWFWKAFFWKFVNVGNSVHKDRLPFWFKCQHHSQGFTFMINTFTSVVEGVVNCLQKGGVICNRMWKWNSPVWPGYPREMAAWEACVQLHVMLLLTYLFVFM